MTFKVLAIGDVIGKPGRACLSKMLPLARDQFNPDIVIVNGENAAGGFGITKKIYQQFVDNFGIDCVTMGNHWHDKPEIHSFAPQAERMVLPANMMNVGRLDAAYRVLRSRSGINYAVINLIGRAFMHPDNRDFFVAVENILAQIPDNCKIRIVDFHGEATSEKQGIAQFLRGRVSLCYGTHSHVPSADERILGNFTGFTTDLGMTGPYDSVIGIRTEAALQRMQTGEKRKFEPATSELWLCFIVAEIEPTTGRCVAIQRHRWEWEKLKDHITAPDELD
ncbi:MAG: TIGR00282 family metallophosphoesterase [Proteobacteria bacterium]|nr:TIGR00282 family metallophosphoesterase [Pseudomonadota bacterium]